MAWDAHDSRLFAEALDYLDEIPPDSPVAAEAAWLRAECWYDLGDYPRATASLLTPAASGLEDRDGFLLDIFWGHAWDATRRERYGEALDVLGAARALFPGDGDLHALEAATLYRRELAADLAGEGTGSGDRGRIVSRRRLLKEIWGYADPDRVETRSVDMHIVKLRKKLGREAGALIETVRGEGYRYTG